MNIKNPEVARLVEEVTAVTGESKTEAIRQALLERRSRLRSRVSEAGRAARLRRFLEEDVWRRIPADELGRAPDRARIEAILGYGPGGV